MGETYPPHPPPARPSVCPSPIWIDHRHPDRTNRIAAPVNRDSGANRTECFAQESSVVDAEFRESLPCSDGDFSTRVHIALYVNTR